MHETAGLVGGGGSLHGSSRGLDVAVVGACGLQRPVTPVIGVCGSLRALRAAKAEVGRSERGCDCCLSGNYSSACSRASWALPGICKGICKGICCCLVPQLAGCQGGVRWSLGHQCLEGLGNSSSGAFCGQGDGFCFLGNEEYVTEDNVA